MQCRGATRFSLLVLCLTLAHCGSESGSSGDSGIGGGSESMGGERAGGSGAVPSRSGGAAGRTTASVGGTGGTPSVSAGAAGTGPAIGGMSFGGVDAGSDDVAGTGGLAMGGVANGDGVGGEGLGGMSSGGTPTVEAGGSDAAGSTSTTIGGSAGGGSSTSGSGGSGAGSSGGGGTAGVLGRAVVVDGKRILVGGEPFHIRGVNWNPVPRGGRHPEDLDFAGFAATDIPLMQSAGLNAVRTYEPLLDRAVLDQFEEAGIFVLNTVYPYGGAAPSVVTDRVNQVKDHPAILMWVIGNEWNYNGLYTSPQGSFEQSISLLAEASALIKAADASHPIASVYGELAGIEVAMNALPDVDVWGINAYRGISFGELFATWETLTSTSPKPMFLAEYGADAFNSITGSPDVEAQAEATRALTQEILANSAALAEGSCSGGTVFEWADEWWKAEGDPSAHDNGGIGVEGGPHPDNTFNEEWWGLVDIDRNARPAYYELQSLYTN